MSNFVKKMIEDKKEYKKQMKRVEAFPEDYQFVFKKIQNYLWRFASGDGMDMMRLQYHLIDLFEEGANDNRHVLEITGEDVAKFCDDLLTNTKKWTDTYRDKLNRRVNNKVGE